MCFSIKYNVELNFSLYDIKYYLKKNQKILISFLVLLLFGIVVGIIIATSSDSYLSLLTNSDKLFYDYVNGKASFSKQATRLIFSSILLDIIFFVLSLNFYLSFLSYLIVSYQGCLMFLSVTAVITEYGFRGVLMTLFLSLPVNLILFASNILFASICFKRGVVAHKNRYFSYGLSDKNFWLAIICLLAINVVVALLITFVFGVILRSRIFIIF